MDRVLALVIALVTVAAAAPASQEPAPAVGQPPGLSGEWRFNPERSDDPREKMREMRPRSFGPGSGGGPRGGPGRGFGGRGGRRPGGPPPDGREDLRSLLEAARELTITHTEAEIVVLEKDGRMRIFHPDGKRYEGGRGEAIKARWEDGLIVETRSERGPTVTETFRVSPEDRLEIDVRVEGSVSGGIRFRRVYDRTSQVTPPPGP